MRGAGAEAGGGVRRGGDMALLHSADACHATGFQAELAVQFSAGDHLLRQGMASAEDGQRPGRAGEDADVCMQSCWWGVGEGDQLALGATGQWLRKACSPC